MAEKTPEQIDTSKVTGALIAIQAKIKPLRANATSHHGKFANLQAVMEAVQPLLDEHGLAIIQMPDAGTSGNCTLKTILRHAESGQEIVSTITIPMQRANDPQAYGAAMTYARRYSLMCLFGMVTEDDDAAAASISLEKLLKEMSAAGDFDELQLIKDAHFRAGHLSDKFWNRVYNVIYQAKADALRGLKAA